MKMSSSSTDKFISPFIDGEETQVLNTSNSFHLNFQNFNDSLDDFVPANNQVSTKPGLNDSLCMEDDTQLPIDQPPPEGSSQPSSNSTKQKSSSIPVLDGSLVDDDQTQRPEVLLLSPIPNTDGTTHFEDSLCMEDETQLPLEQPALPQETAGESTSTTSASDSCIDIDETQTINDTTPQSTQSSVTGNKANLELSHNRSQIEVSPKSPLKSTSAQDSAKVKPSFGKKKSFTPPTTASKPQPESEEANKPTSTKLKETKKKPAFSIPKKSKAKSTPNSTEESPAKSVSNRCKSTAMQSATDSSSEVTEQSFSLPKSKKTSPASSNIKEAKKPTFLLSESSANTTKPSELACETSGTKQSSIPKKADSKVLTENKENFDDSITIKPTTKKAAVSRKPKAHHPKKAAAKEEQEKKRLEREKIKQEKEEAKREKARLKEEKKLEQEKKKAEREQKKMEKELKKMEKLQATVSKQKQKANKPEMSKISVCVTEDSETTVKPADSEEKNDEDKESKPKMKPIECDSQDTKEVNENSDSVETASDQKSSSASHHIDQDSDSVSAQETDRTENSSENASTVSVGTEESTENDTVPAQETESTCDNLNTAPLETEPPAENAPDKKTDQGVSQPQDIKKSKGKKRKLVSSSDNVPAAKKLKPDFSNSKPKCKTANNPDSTDLSTKKKSVKKKNNKPAPSSPPYSKPTNYSGPVWVQCEDCEKWRRLTSIRDPSLVPDHWTCSLNNDTEHAQCSAPEEVWSDLGDSQEFIESPYIPGSLVWAKMDGYPWWPAMVEEDPDEEAYYELGRGSNPVPVKYHIVFLDTPVCRAWVHSHNIQVFSDSTDPNEETRVNVPKKYKRPLKMAIKWASKAMGESLKERLEHFSFSQRFRKGIRKRKTREQDSQDEALPAAKPLSRKSARRVLTQIQPQFPSSEGVKAMSQREDIVATETDSSIVPLSDNAETAKASTVAGTTSIPQFLSMAEE